MKQTVVAWNGANVAIAIVVLATPANAQFNINLNSQLLMQRQLLSPIDNQRMRSLRGTVGRPPGLLGGPGRGRVNGPASALRGGPPIETRYQRDAQVSVQARRQFIGFIREAGGPGEAAKVEADFRKYDPVQVWSSLVRDNGLHPGDMADALAAYMSLNWAMATGSDVDAVQARALRSELQGMIATNPNFARMTEQERQSFSEALMCNYIYQHAAFTHAVKSGDHEFARRLGDAAEARFRNEMGLSLRQIALTPHGIEHRG